MKLANIAGSGAGMGLVLPPLHSHPQPLPACVLYQPLGLVSGLFRQVLGPFGQFLGQVLEQVLGQVLGQVPG
jgi:hypothetical protein